jgi:1,4-alpha-glucan branching enzyme
LTNSKKNIGIINCDSFQLQLILDAKHYNPYEFLGVHIEDDHFKLRVFNPHATKIEFKQKNKWVVLNLVHRNGLFEASTKQAIEKPCLLKITTSDSTYEYHDPYTFDVSITEVETYLFGEGKLKQAYNTLGSQLTTLSGVNGVRFAVWAPNANRVSVVGDFNRWDGRTHSMRSLGASGIWEIFIPNLTANDIYKFEIRNRDSGQVLVKSDPYAREFEHKPGTASKVNLSTYTWTDEPWLLHRKQNDWLHAPFNCYEIHLGSWQRNESGHFFNYREMADRLIPHLVDMGYTHVELLPVTEHPLNESWGYQTTGYFAATNRFGTPDDLRFFINALHNANIGVILDWVPGHFPKDDWAIARYDGTALYEHADPRLGEHQDWGTYIFNYGRNEVRNFLLSSAYYWLKEFHIDGLRVDAVASMLYLDYSRKAGEWLPNQYGGRENLDAIAFLHQFNQMIGEDFPGALTIAEESTAWPSVSRPVYGGGLGFSMKWNMGWMNDILSYFAEDPVNRKYHHSKLTFGQIYAYSENFVLPFSHDEVVHGKKSLLNKMPGDTWQKFANLRLLTTFQMTSPGKKLNFMGNEFGQVKEWNVNASLDWHLLADNHPEHLFHRGIQRLNHDLNHLYLNLRALHDLDFNAEGFEWIDCNDDSQSIISFIRRGKDRSFAIIVLNFTPVPRHDYRLGVPEAGYYRELLNSDATCYGGGEIVNRQMQTDAIEWMGKSHSIVLTLPPLAGVILQMV